MLANTSPSSSSSLKLTQAPAWRDRASALQLTPDKLLQGLSAAPILRNPVSCITISGAGPCTAAKVRVFAQLLRRYKIWHGTRVRLYCRRQPSHRNRSRVLTHGQDPIASILYKALRTSSGVCKMSGFAPPFPQPAAAWQEHKTPEGRAYYYNNVTKVTQWTKPEEMMSMAEVSSLFFQGLSRSTLV